MRGAGVLDKQVLDLGEGDGRHLVLYAEDERTSKRINNGDSTSMNGKQRDHSYNRSVTSSLRVQ